MKVKVIKNFVDINNSTITHKIGEVLTLDDESRVQNIINLCYGELIEEDIEKVPEKKTAKRIKK